MSVQPQNHLLAALPDNDLRELLSGAHRVNLQLGADVIAMGANADPVLFPEVGIISLVTEGDNGMAVEAGFIGVEGGAALIEALGSGATSFRGLVQASGQAWSLRRHVCRKLFQTIPAFQEAAIRSFEFHATEARQSLYCRSHHIVERRLARWLLEMADRANADPRTIILTHEFLAIMLAVQRTTVTKAANALRSLNLIGYSRGKITIRDVRGLEHYSCSCRSTIQSERQKILSRRSFR